MNMKIFYNQTSVCDCSIKSIIVSECSIREFQSILFVM